MCAQVTEHLHLHICTVLELFDVDAAVGGSVLTQGCLHAVQEKGYEIVASFGDQWSDLAGTSAAVASFKLPNPFYYIL